MVNLKRFAHVPLADYLALGLVHDPGRRHLRGGDAPVGAANLHGGKAAVYHIGAVIHSGSLGFGNKRSKAAEVVPPIRPFQPDILVKYFTDLVTAGIQPSYLEVNALAGRVRHNLKARLGRSAGGNI